MSLKFQEQNLNDTSKSKQTPMQHQDLHSAVEQIPEDIEVVESPLQSRLMMPLRYGPYTHNQLIWNSLTMSLNP